MDKHRYSNKIYTFPSGNIVKLMGYEPKAINVLLFIGYKEEDLLLKNRPSIKCFWPIEGGGDNTFRYYHPDIIIPSENRIIEVKSDYTIKDPKLPYKKIGCEKQGWTFDVWIFK